MILNILKIMSGKDTFYQPLNYVFVYLFIYLFIYLFYVLDRARK